jgi:hypothetical protein
MVFAIPPYIQRFMRGKWLWTNFLAKTPADLMRYMFMKRPAVGFGFGIWTYLYWYKWPLERAEQNRFKRWRENWLADVHLQENTDWGNKRERDSMKAFVEKQVAKFGSLEVAAAEYAKSSGKTAPPFKLDDAVLDTAFKRVGVPVEKEVNFLWDGTSYMGSDKPPTFSNGKIRVPEAPSFYRQNA